MAAIRLNIRATGNIALAVKFISVAINIYYMILKDSISQFNKHINCIIIMELLNAFFISNHFLLYFFKSIT